MQEDPKRILDLFESAMVEPAETRDAWLRTACEGDPVLLEGVQKLMLADASSDNGIVTGGVWTVHATLQPGVEIGAYRILESIGSGGMGSVYKAERADGAFQRTVAIKIVSQEVLSDHTRARFVNERQILAGLTHPNIAQLIDGGTSDGMGFIVLEYVEGEDFVFDDQRAESDTLQKFSQVCRAVQYAHNNLVLHRDIKPSNVILTHDGQPKLLDFGVAKIGQTVNESDHLDITGINPVPMTVNFAAPERLDGQPATIASEVFSLGAFLHTVLYRSRPYDLSGLSFSEAKKRVSEREVPKSLTDLQLIIATAMHSDPSRRYPSAAALADDVERYLSMRPIAARGDDWRYLAGRVLERHRAAAISVLVGVALLAGALVYSVNQTRIAELERTNTQAMNEFLQSIFLATDPRSGSPLGPAANMRDLMKTAEERIENQSPMLQLQLFGTFAQIYNSLKLTVEADRMVAEAEGLMANMSELHPGQEFQVQLAKLASYHAKNELEDANKNCEHTLSLMANIESTSADAFSAHIICADVKLNSGLTESAMEHAKIAREILRNPQSRFPEYFIPTALADIANVYSGFGMSEAMDEVTDEAVEMAKSLGENGLATLSYLYLAKSLHPNQIGDNETSLRYTTLALDTANQSPLSKSGVMYAFTQLYHADRLIDAGRIDEASEIFGPARVVLLQDTAETSAYHSLVHFTDYKLAFQQREFKQAEISLLASQQVRIDAGESYTQWMAATDHALGKVYIELGDFESAVVRLRPAFELYLEIYGAQHQRVVLYKDVLDSALEQLETVSR